MERGNACLKLAVSTHPHPNLTTQRLSSSTSFTLVQRSDFSGAKKPLSRANCSRQTGRKRVRETTAKTSLINDQRVFSAWGKDILGKGICQPPFQLATIFGSSLFNIVLHEGRGEEPARLERVPLSSSAEALKPDSCSQPPPSTIKSLQKWI